MHLVVIAWMYVVLMMSVAEAAGPQGTVLGALVTLVLYGVLPLSIVVYILGTPSRKRALRQAQQAQEAQAPPVAEPQATASAEQTDGSGHAPGAAPATGVSPVREEPPRV